MIEDEQSKMRIMSGFDDADEVLGIGSQPKTIFLEFRKNVFWNLNEFGTKCSIFDGLFVKILLFFFDQRA